VYSAESNLRADGGARINVNQPLLTSLYDELQEQYGDEIATFIVAFRMSGAVEPVSDGGQATTGDQSTDEAIKGVAEDVAKGLFKSGGDTSVTRGGMDLSAGGKVNFVSLYELIDAQVEATVNQKPAVLSSPWSSDNLQSDWAMVADGLTLSDATSIDGRININQARREVLLGIPGITEEMVDAIVSQTQVASSGVVVDDRKSTTAWLLTDGIMDLPTLVAMDKFMTARGAVQRVQSVGFFASGGPVARVEAVIDGSQSPPRIVYRRDLSSLGPGYSADELTGITK
jgi:DNA uptake protein ComE-like DNA-binding protein